MKPSLPEMHWPSTHKKASFSIVGPRLWNMFLCFSPLLFLMLGKSPSFWRLLLKQVCNYLHIFKWHIKLIKKKKKGVSKPLSACPRGRKVGYKKIKYERWSNNVVKQDDYICKNFDANFLFCMYKSYVCVYIQLSMCRHVNISF